MAKGSVRGMRVGISLWTMTDLFGDIIEVMQQEASLHGVEVGPVLDANADIAGQVVQAEGLLSENVQGILILAARSEGWDDFVHDAVKKGIYVFTYNPGPTTGATMNIFKLPGGGTTLGRAAGAWINATHRGRAEFATLVFKASPSLEARGEAMREAVLEIAPDSIFVGEIEAATFLDGQEAMRQLLRKHPNLRALLCFNDDGALGAHAAATEAGRRGPEDLWIGGFDGIRFALEKIEEGGIYQGTISFFVTFSAVQVMRDMIKCFQGTEVFPTRSIGFQLITAANVVDHRRLIADPLAPEVQDLYKELITYADEPLITAPAYSA